MILVSSSVTKLVPGTFAKDGEWHGWVNKQKICKNVTRKEKTLRKKINTTVFPKLRRLCTRNNRKITVITVVLPLHNGNKNRVAAGLEILESSFFLSPTSHFI